MASINAFSSAKIIEMCLEYTEEQLNKELLSAYKELRTSTGTISKQIASDKVETIESIIGRREDIN